MRRSVSVALAWLGLLTSLTLGCRSYDTGLLASDGSTASGSDAGDAASQPGECELLPAKQRDVRDGDDDGIPDLVERQYGFDPASPDSPGGERIAYLSQEAGEETTFVVDVWVDGDDYIYAGRFRDVGSNDRAGWSADGFHESSEANGGEPQDHVFRIEPAAAEIGPVRGTTRLRYTVRFAFGSTEPRPCHVVLPFRYVLDREDGSVLNTQSLYLLVLVPADAADEPAWCLPAACS